MGPKVAITICNDSIPFAITCKSRPGFVHSPPRACLVDHGEGVAALYDEGAVAVYEEGAVHGCSRPLARSVVVHRHDHTRCACSRITSACRSWSEEQSKLNQMCNTSIHRYTSDDSSSVPRDYVRCDVIIDCTTANPGASYTSTTAITPSTLTRLSCKRHKVCTAIFPLSTKVAKLPMCVNAQECM